MIKIYLTFPHDVRYIYSFYLEAGKRKTEDSEAEDPSTCLDYFTPLENKL